MSCWCSPASLAPVSPCSGNKSKRTPDQDQDPGPSSPLQQRDLIVAAARRSLIRSRGQRPQRPPIPPTCSPATTGRTLNTPPGALLLSGSPATAKTWAKKVYSQNWAHLVFLTSDFAGRQQGTRNATAVVISVSAEAMTSILGKY